MSDRASPATKPLLPEPPRAGGLPPHCVVEIAALAIRAQRANSPVMSLMNRIGLKVEARMDGLPPGIQAAIDRGTAELLTRAYRAAGIIGAHPSLPSGGDWAQRIAAAAGGALGGAGGLGTALVELPATVTLFFSVMQKAAAEQGFDPVTEETRRVCLEIFGAGGPLHHDDGVNSGFVGARLAANGATLNALIQQVAPAVAVVLGRKLASQAVPVLGAAAGAGINLAFLGYYRDMAHVRFGLMRLTDSHGETEVLAQFRQRVLALRQAGR